MNNHSNIINELTTISPAVASIDRRNVYSVPSGYFYDLANRITSHVQKIHLPVTGKSGGPFKVPTGYFENLSSNILGNIKQQLNSENDIQKELAEIAPLLNTISKRPVYSVPEGYFEKSISLNKVGNGKIVPINRSRQFVRYAVAAAITGVMALGGTVYLNKQIGDDFSATSKFNPQEVNKLSEGEILEYLKSNPGATEVTFVDGELESEREKYTIDLTEEEITNYLEENSEGTDYQKEG